MLSLFPFPPKPPLPFSDMGLHHRKLMSEDCDSICNSCSWYCSDCQHCFSDHAPPHTYSVSPPAPRESHTKHHAISIYLIIILALVAGTFLLVCCYALYARFFSGGNRSRRRVPSLQQTEDTPDDFLDEEHGPVVDHPIWYIRTPGLQQSIISAITVFKYKKGEGLIEGTECSVCLSEFQEDEDLRLLPKCNHAFHLPCIDTWLRSHTNCPMCRAPIVTNPARIPSLEHNFVGSSSVENTQMESLESGVETSGGMENSAVELRNGGDEEGQLEVEDERRVPETESSGAEVVNIQPRRSVSLDSSSAAKINIALATVLSAESDGNSNSQLVNEPIVSKSVTGNNENLPATAKGGSSSSSRTRSLQSAPSSMKRSRSYSGKNLLSWNNRSQKKPNAPLRSF